MLVFLNIGVNENGIKSASANRVRIKNTLSLSFRFLYYRVRSIPYNRVHTLPANMLLSYHRGTGASLAVLAAAGHRAKAKRVGRPSASRCPLLGIFLVHRGEWQEPYSYR